MQSLQEVPLLGYGSFPLFHFEGRVRGALVIYSTSSLENIEIVLVKNQAASIFKINAVWWSVVLRFVNYRAHYDQRDSVSIFTGLALR